MTSEREKEKERFATINGHENTDKRYEICLLQTSRLTAPKSLLR